MTFYIAWVVFMIISMALRRFGVISSLTLHIGWGFALCILGIIFVFHGGVLIGFLFVLASTYNIYRALQEW